LPATLPQQGLDRNEFTLGSQVPLRMHLRMTFGNLQRPRRVTGKRQPGIFQ